ncbi:hypothetical protein MJO28_003628 [Puccinia striiformis f. sp. tritici]|uniref:Uncharacterized protein n=4 Tax=Puccinia striiformis TaxID=27350 RepID=A0A0L0VI87_9BASI|nr:hypothetical protein Pst134EA_007765 [Puccinia striiformis f. sp. tritici]KAI9610919.1 hypothetical protein H4Q26_008764 [Puccinia striiformis f. sp. tritici PST-130]KNE98992.1 hypothetical protein PSTG_07837 [Puccinia striiformis f. sp. tritici PST-78]POW12281.1 hypothetical protein PSTT_04584 [Puccinia striiformis]KAH9460669.1 hypothetical protein Pst134EB_008832 [Puccinia striiformis f. sp. tritici]KAH9470513.1 hypothetical protein Pst134EA_007765 [Puccinia striiformis f. sp. tritici]
MADADPIEPLTTNISELRIHQHQGDLVILRFENLARKNDSTWKTRAKAVPGTGTEGIKLIDSKRYSFRQLYSTLLPLASQQVNRLAELLVPADLRRDPILQLKLLSELQDEIDYNLDKIRDNAYVAIVESSPAALSSDGVIREQESFRLFLLEDIENEFLDLLGSTFRHASELIRMLGLSAEVSISNIGITRENVLEYTNRLDFKIMSLQHSLSHTDLDNSDHVIAHIDSAHHRTLLLIQDELAIPARLPSLPQIDPRFQVAKLVIPITKLSKLFFLKLLRREMDIRYPRPLPTGAYPETAVLHELPSMAVHQLQMILISLTDSYLPEGQAGHLSLRALGDNLCLGAYALKTCFRRYLVAVNCFLDTRGGMATQKTWFRTWDTLITLAIHNLVDAVELFRQDQ